MRCMCGHESYSGVFVFTCIYTSDHLVEQPRGDRDSFKPHKSHNRDEEYP